LKSIEAATNGAGVLHDRDPCSTSTSTVRWDSDGKRLGYPSRVVAALAAMLAFGVPAQAVAQIACRPILTFKEARFSEPQNQLRKWTGILSVDARRCAATSGAFEIKFVRIKEMGADLLFSERFRWTPGVVEVSLDFWWDEAVLDYWIGEVSPCRCLE
jgi:hypothetical protein